MVRMSTTGFAGESGGVADSARWMEPPGAGKRDCLRGGMVLFEGKVGAFRGRTRFLYVPLNQPRRSPQTTPILPSNNPSPTGCRLVERRIQHGGQHLAQLVRVHAGVGQPAPPGVRLRRCRFAATGFNSKATWFGI